MAKAIGIGTSIAPFQDVADGPEAVSPESEEAAKEGSARGGAASTKEGEEEEEEGGRGFGGIQMRSVRDIIAKARADEDFFTASTMVGLSNRIEDLVKLVDGEDEEDGILFLSLPVTLPQFLHILSLPPHLLPHFL